LVIRRATVRVDAVWREDGVEAEDKAGFTDLAGSELN